MRLGRHAFSAFPLLTQGRWEATLLLLPQLRRLAPMQRQSPPWLAVPQPAEAAAAARSLQGQGQVRPQGPQQERLLG
jgi:hypothetical protein